TYGSVAFLAVLALLIVMDAAGLSFALTLGPDRLPSLIFDGLSSAATLVLCGMMIVFFVLTLGLAWPLEVALLVLFALLGMLMMVSADSFLAFYLGLEMQSLALYVFIALQGRQQPPAIEAALKYFILGALASGLMLLGMSFLYGQWGGLRYAHLLGILTQPDLATAALLWTTLGAGLILVGFLFKLSLVPFHMWTPDVYQAAPTSVVAFLASLPKMAATVALVRLLAGPFYPLMPDLGDMLRIIGALSMLWGALAGLRQTSLRRLMAYSTIAQMGFVVMALSVPTAEGMGSALVYVVVYAVTSLGLFALLMRVSDNDLSFNDVAGLVKTSPVTAYLLGVFLLSLAGMPFFAGFFTKLAVFQSVLAGQHYAVVFAAALSSVVAMYYYLRVIKVMIFDDAATDQGVVMANHGASLPLGIAAALALCVFFIAPGPQMMDFAQKLVGDLRSEAVSASSPDPFLPVVPIEKE
ncbi:MAG: NADH-quinone oxidoreductase subunit N, partial [Alphaproteobacteria bacterium]